MRTIDTDKYHYEVFDTFGEMVRFAQSNKAPQSSNKREKEDWSGGCKSLQDACTLAATGWDAVRPEVDGLLDNVTERLASRLSDLYVTTNDFGGAYVDMGAYVQGEPECMVTFQSVPDGAVGRVVKIVVSGTVSWDIPQEHIRRRGVAILALVDTIARLGVAVELWWDSTVSGSGTQHYTTAVKLHDSTEVLDINSIMFGLAHPSMLRRLTFSVQEQSPKAREQHVGGGYGCPANLGLPALDNDFDVVVERLQNGRGDIVQDPFGWVMSTLQGLDLIREDM